MPNGGLASTAEVTTLQLEFKYLSHLTGDPKYWIAVAKVNNSSKCAVLDLSNPHFSGHENRATGSSGGWAVPGPHFYLASPVPFHWGSEHLV